MLHVYTAVWRKVVLQKGKSLCHNVKSYYHNDGFYGCLIEPQGVSAKWKVTAQTQVFVFSHSFVLNHLEPRSSKVKLLPIMPISIVAYALLQQTDTFISVTILQFRRLLLKFFDRPGSLLFA